MSYARLHLTSGQVLRGLMHWAPNGRSLTIREFAAAIGVSKSKVEAMLSEERPTATREVADRICEVLDVRRDALFLSHCPRPRARAV